VASASSSPATWVNFHEPASFDTSEMNWDLADYGEDDPNQPIVPTVSFIDGSDSNVTVIPLSGHETFNENATIVPLEDRIVGGTAAPSSHNEQQHKTEMDVCIGWEYGKEHARHIDNRIIRNISALSNVFLLFQAGVVTTSCPSNLFIPNLPSPSSIFCTAAANPNPGRHCFGDSGGFVGGSAGGRAVVVGVVSFGDCTNVSGSTRVSFFTSFIRSACGNCQ
jgi:hypothetical protein